MKRLLSAVALTALALSAGSALAADLPYRKDQPVYVPPPPPPATWTGLYAGANIGGGWGAGSGNSNFWNVFGLNGGVTNHLGGGVLGGLQVGYNYSLTPLFLVGLETDFQGTSMPAFTGNGGLDWFGTLRGRVGVTIMPTLLIYGTGGFAYGEFRSGVTQSSAIQTGWTAGGGVEWMFMPNWSAKLEYLYSDISGGNVNGFNAGIGINNVNNHTRWNTVRAGVSYHFNLGAPAPVVAKY
jgi:outer membrane immunogenic protein